MAKQDDYIKTALRLPRALHEALTNAASDRGHSLNAEMVARLGGSFDSKKGTSLAPPQLAKMLAENNKLRFEMARLRSAVKPAPPSPETDQKALLLPMVGAGKSTAMLEMYKRLVDEAMPKRKPGRLAKATNRKPPTKKRLRKTT